MAFGGTPNIIFSGPLGPFKYYVRIDGLTLAGSTGMPPDPANPDTGQLTTGIPGPNQIGIPIGFAVGRGNWRPGMEFMILDPISLIYDSALGSFAAPCSAIDSPQIIGNDLVITRTNTVPAVGNLPVRITIQYKNSLVR